MLHYFLFTIHYFHSSVYFYKKSDCDEYRHYIEPGEIYEVVWNGEVYPTFCFIRIEMSGIDTYKLCAEVTLFNLECERYGDETRLLQFFYYSGELKDEVCTVFNISSHNKLEMLLKDTFLYPPQQNCRGVYWFHHVRPSVRPSVDKSYVVR